METFENIVGKVMVILVMASMWSDTAVWYRDNYPSRNHLSYTDVKSVECVSVNRTNFMTLLDVLEDWTLGYKWTNSLRLSDPYIRQQTNHPYFR